MKSFLTSDMAKAILILGLFILAVLLFVIGILYGVSATTWQHHVKAIALVLSSIPLAMYSKHLSWTL